MIETLEPTSHSDAAPSTSEVRGSSHSWLKVMHGPLFGIVATAVFFRDAFRSGFDQLQGNYGDSRLIVYLHEHGFRSLRGLSDWRSPAFFYPKGGVLGFSDTFALNQVLYTPLRGAGLDSFHAFQWTIILLTVVGYVCALRCLRLIAGSTSWLVSALAVVVTFSNPLFLKAGHPQMAGIHWLWIVGSCLAYALTDRRGTSWLAFLGGLVWGLTFVSFYYVAWLSALALLITFGLVLPLGLRRRAPLGTWLAARYGRVGVAIAGAVLGLLPAVYVYGPVLDDSGGRRYADVVGLLGRPHDLVNIGDGNLLWGDLNRRMQANDARSSNVEFALGLTPAMWGVVGALALLSLWALMTRRGEMRFRLLGAAVGTVAINALLPVNFAGVSAWRVVHQVVPGAVGIRAAFRHMLIVYMLWGIMVALALRCCLSRLSHHPVARTLMGLTACLTMVEQVNTQNEFVFDRSNELAFVSSIPTAPAGCEAFYVTSRAGSNEPYFVPNLDAMWISMRTGLPTINGYSGNTPRNFRAYDASAPDYDAQIMEWIKSNKVSAQGVCVYDREANIWLTPSG
jgi:hypothetical protein